MKNLEKFNNLELSKNEMKNTDGGIVPLLIVGGLAAAAIGGYVYLKNEEQKIINETNEANFEPGLKG